MLGGGEGRVEPAVLSGNPQGISMSIRADLKLKIPHISSAYMGFAVPPTQPLFLLISLFFRVKVVSRQMES